MCLDILTTKLKACAYRSYTRHSAAREPNRALRACLDRIGLGQGAIALQVGSGSNRINPAIVNLDLSPGATVDCCGRAESLPFRDKSFSAVICQELLEHVQYPCIAVSEMYRVLKPDGLLFCQVPFIIGYHPGPTDYWRFTLEGIQQIVTQAGFVCESITISVGAAFGFYRVAVEFGAVLASSIFPRTYKSAKGVLAILLCPITLIDTFVTRSSDERHRIPGGYFIIAHKPGHHLRSPSGLGTTFGDHVGQGNVKPLA